MCLIGLHCFFSVVRESLFYILLCLKCILRCWHINLLKHNILGKKSFKISTSFEDISEGPANSNPWCHFDKKTLRNQVSPFPYQHSSIVYITCLFSGLNMSFHVFKTESIRLKCLFLFQMVLKVLKVISLVVVKGAMAYIPNQDIQDKQCWWTSLFQWKCLIQPELDY